MCTTPDEDTEEKEKEIESFKQELLDKKGGGGDWDRKNLRIPCRNRWDMNEITKRKDNKLKKNAETERKRVDKSAE